MRKSHGRLRYVTYCSCGGAGITCTNLISDCKIMFNLVNWWARVIEHVHSEGYMYL